MFDRAIRQNNLVPEFEKYNLKETDIKFIKESNPVILTLILTLTLTLIRTLILTLITH